MRNFAIIGVGGYIAPRHIQAINDIGGKIVCAYDLNDSVGILDRYTQDVSFFTDFERFSAHIDSLKDTENKINYITICSPNYMHASHIKFALKNDCDAICEKPLVLNLSEIEELRDYEKKYNKKVYTILQLRVHQSLVDLKKKIDEADSSEKHNIELTYITSRGPWYHESWKGREEKSGGLASNIGVHFFDMLTWVFGELKSSEIHLKNKFINAGYLELEKAKVKWILSVDRKYLPKFALDSGKTTYRSINVDGEEFEFSGGFTDLHTRVYEETLSNNGFTLDDTETAIKIVERLRDSEVIGTNENSHPYLKDIL